MRKVILYIAASLDNFIARPDGDVEWLNAPELLLPGEDYGYRKFYDSIDTTLMGYRTYQAILGFDVPFPYPDKTNYVFTRSETHADTSEVTFISGDVVAFVRDLKEQPGRDVWLIGGGQINTLLLEQGLIDRKILTLIPVILGKGIPLFHGNPVETRFNPVSGHYYTNGVVQWILDPLK
ncbi:MAG: dihydrofolate reductase family protein [Bacteroidales bacterium]